jgi:hypothetical protein
MLCNVWYAKVNVVDYVPMVLSGFLAKSHLSRLSHQSCRSLMIRVIMK